ncbi:MAG: methionyl-tRNA formyltransferase [Patescibacteria group bacterium]
MIKKFSSDTSIVFFGTPQFAVWTLDALEKGGIVPDIVVTAPDKPQGRGLLIQPSPVKVWATERDIPVLEPLSLKTKSSSDPSGQTSGFSQEDEAMDLLLNSEWDLFIVAAYGKLIPKELINLPRKGTINVHPSLLPKFRGASPIPSQILADEKNIGVSIMLIDEKMDHGPLLAQASVTPEEWPLKSSLLEEMLATIGGELLAETCPPWLDETISPEAQNHDLATFTAKIEKADGEISLTDDGYKNYLKYCAYDVWPGTFFFVEKAGKKMRVKITDAEYSNGVFTPLLVIPEGKKEIDYKKFIHSTTAS